MVPLSLFCFKFSDPLTLSCFAPRFVPQRPDIGADKPGGEISPEYEAFELCGPKEVLVMSSVGPWESVGGDIKFLRLMQRQVLISPCSPAPFIPLSPPSYLFRQPLVEE